MYEADRHAKKGLKNASGGYARSNDSWASRTGPEAAIIQGYCSAVRSALTDDGRPPLVASGLKLHDRLSTISQSLDRLGKKGACPSHSPGCRPPPAGLDGHRLPVARRTGRLRLGASGGADPHQRTTAAWGSREATPGGAARSAHAAPGDRRGACARPGPLPQGFTQLLARPLSLLYCPRAATDQ